MMDILNPQLDIGDKIMYVVIVPIQIEQGHRDEFLEALMVDAKGANEDEPGCLRFDAVQDADDDHRWRARYMRVDESNRAELARTGQERRAEHARRK